MKEEPQILVEKISLTIRGNIANSVRNFEVARKEHKIE